MKNKIEVVPEGKGFELEYDNYNAGQDRHFASADEWWKSYCLLGEKEFDASVLKEDLLRELNNDKYLAMVVNHFVGENYRAWLDKEGIDSLGGFTPRECLYSSYGIKRLRMLFLTMH